MKDTSTNFKGYPIVKCVMASEENYLILGHRYTVIRETVDGHVELFEIEPPSPYTCFHRERFEYTGDYVTLNELFPEYQDPQYYDVEEYYVHLSKQQQEDGNTESKS